MKWNSLLQIFVVSWLIGSCQTLATPEQPNPGTLEATKLAQPPMTATLRSTTTPVNIHPTSTSTPDVAATVIAITTQNPFIFSRRLMENGSAEVVIYDCVKVDPAGDC